MDIRYYFRHMPTSEALKTFTDDKLSSVEALIHDRFPVHVSFSQEKDQWLAKLSCHSVDKHPVEVKADSEDIHKSVDLVTEKLAKVLRRRKNKVVDQRQSSLGHELDQRQVDEELESRVLEEAIDARELVEAHA